jgi:hypothetical protein
MSDQSESGSKGSKLHDVFISYGREDRDIAQNLAEELRRRGLRPWLDSELTPGCNWKEEIQKAIENSQFCVVVLSETSGALKPWTSREWASIQECSWRRPDMQICSLRIENTEPPAFLREKQYVACKRESSDVRSAADHLLLLFKRRFFSSAHTEKDVYEVQTHQRFVEIARVLRDLAQKNQEDTGE